MSGGTVYIVDDEPDLRRALERLLRTTGLAVKGYSSAAEFLAEPPADEDACLLLDLAMPGIDGLALQAHLAERRGAMPIVFLTGHGDIPTSVRAIKAGAVDFLTKPVKADELLHAIDAALGRARGQRAAEAAGAALRARFALLTPREQEVLRHVIAGKLNKVIAGDLGTTEQTIKVHRGRVMEKLAANSVAELVRLAQQLDVTPER